MDPDGKNMRVYASGIRNAGGGLAINPKNGELWCSTNERDGLGNNLVPDLHYSCAGRRLLWLAVLLHRRQSRAPVERRASRAEVKVIVPDVLLQAHNASLQLAFYEGKSFPRNIRATFLVRNMARGTATRASATK